MLHYSGKNVKDNRLQIIY